MSDGPERLVVLLGYPLGHSRSPAIHNASFEAQGLPFRYQSHPVPPGKLGESIQLLREADFAGANVTVPHKQAVLDFVDERSAIVDAVGAANTLVLRVQGDAAGTALFADNTDVGGFLATLDGSPFLDEPCTILGSGGAARAVAYGMTVMTGSPRVTVAGRNPNRVRALVDALSPFDDENKLKAIVLGEAQSEIRDAGLVVNATPVGMYPHVDETPWPDTSVFHGNQLVYDLIYNPERTRLLKDAHTAGAQTMGGLDMLLEQAALSYLLWTGREMDRGAAKEALIR